MTRFVLSRIGIFVATLFAASMAVFASILLAPGDPIDFLLGNRPSTPAQRAALAEQYHLDQPFAERYVSWLRGLLSGDLGESIQQHAPVSELLRTAAPTTALLVLMTFLIVVAAGLLLGGLAKRRSRLVDDGVSALMSISIATPAFVAATVLISVFAVGFGWFPVFGQGTGWGDRLHHLALPAIALSVGWWPVVGSVVQTSIREEMGREHVETAFGRGLPRRHVFRRHVLRNSLVPIVTAAGLSLAGMVVGSAIVETAFQLNGLGGLLISSVTQKDFPVAQAIAMVLLVMFALTNLLVDLLTAFLDPRVRSQWSPS
ncbi:ABC transporter permease [Nonomuraea sp. NPDC004702]